MKQLDETFNLLDDPFIEQLMVHEENKLLVYRRGPLVFVFNFHPTQSYADLRIPVPDPDGLPARPGHRRRAFRRLRARGQADDLPARGRTDGRATADREDLSSQSDGRFWRSVTDGR